MKKLALCSVALALAGSAALAQISTESLVADYQAQGFTRIEVRSGLTQTKVEAIRGTEKIEVILDTASGAVLKSESGSVDRFENSAPGIVIRDRNRDFLRVSSSDEATDDDEQHHAGSDDGPDHDRGDDHDDDDHDDQGQDDGDHGGHGSNGNSGSSGSSDD